MKNLWFWLKNKKTYISVGLYFLWKGAKAFIPLGLTPEQAGFIDISIDTLMGYGLFDKIRRNEKENKTIGKAAQAVGKAAVDVKDFVIKK